VRARAPGGIGRGWWDVVPAAERTRQTLGIVMEHVIVDQLLEAMRAV